MSKLFIVSFHTGKISVIQQNIKQESKIKYKRLGSIVALYDFVNI